MDGHFAAAKIAARVSEFVTQVGRRGKPSHETIKLRGGNLLQNEQKQLRHQPSLAHRALDESGVAPRRPHLFAVAQQFADDPADGVMNLAALRQFAQLRQPADQLRRQVIAGKRVSPKAADHIGAEPGAAVRLGNRIQQPVGALDRKGENR